MQRCLFTRLPPFLQFYHSPRVSYNKARTLWFLFSLMTFCAGALATVEMCDRATKTIGMVAVGIIAVSSTGEFGNPGVPAIGLAVTAIWLLLKRRGGASESLSSHFQSSRFG
jgi:LPXTG-motif cell wall-anchored protein